MTSAQSPTDQQVDAFVGKLQEFRGTLDEGDQKLLDSMFHAAMGTHAAKDDAVQAYWVAVGPRGGTVYGGVHAWGARPWGVAYGNYYGYYG